MTSNTQTPVSTDGGSGLLLPILVITAIATIASTLFVDVITDVPKELPLALVGPLFGGLTLALLMTQYNRRQQSGLFGAVDDLEGRIAEQNALIETQRDHIRELESAVDELQGRNWGQSRSPTQASQSTPSRDVQQSRPGKQARQPTGESRQSSVSDSKAREERIDQQRDAESPRHSAHHEDLVQRVEVSSDQPSE